MGKLYDENERQAFKKANKCLIDLNTIIGSTKDANYAATVKRLILAFVSESRLVEKIVAEHDPSLKEKSARNFDKGPGVTKTLFKK